MPSAPASSYDKAVKALHWVIFFLLFVVLLTVLAMDFPWTQEMRGTIMTIHKTIGLLVLMLMAFRLIWVALHLPPRFLKDSLPEWQKKVENLLLKALYLFTFLPAVTGWVLASAGPYPLTLFNVIAFPKIPLPESLLQIEGFRHDVSEFHEFSANTLLILVVAHIAISLWHHFRLRDALMFRITPRSTHKFLQRLRG